MGVEPGRLAGEVRRPAKILVVDDDAAIRELIYGVLERPEREVSLARDGQQALSFLERDAYSIAILDLRLPDVDGLTLLRQIRERNPDTGVLVLSARADAAMVSEALRLGAGGYLRKPLEDIALLSHAVDRLLERRDLLLANRYLTDELTRVNRELRRQRRRELRRLEELGLALAGALQHAEVVEVLMRAVSAALRCDVLAVFVFDSELGGPSLRVHSQWPLDDALLVALHGAAEQTAATPRSLDRAAANAEVTIQPTGSRGSPPTLGTLAASALAVRGDCLGALVVGAERLQAFAPEELQLLRILCNQAAVALDNARLFHQAQFMAVRDGLTGLLNHRAFYNRLEEEISRARRHHTPLSLIILDADHMKHINDRYGHLAGDEMVRVFAQLIAQTVRRSDTVARYGGDEFAILLPHTTSEAALILCERLRRIVEEHRFVVDGVTEQLGASYGLAGYDPQIDRDGALFVRRADEALYRAKTGGRNRIEVAPAAIRQ